MLQHELQKAFMFLYTDSVKFVAIHLDQTDRVRHYSWTYRQIERILVTDEPGKHSLCLHTRDELGNSELVDVIFPKEFERNVYARRFKTLMNLSKGGATTGAEKVGGKSSNLSSKHQVEYQPSQQVVRDDQHSESFGPIMEKLSGELEAIKLCSPKNDQTAPSVASNMFSPENLKRLAQVSSQESISESVTTSEGPTFDATAQVDDKGNLTLPIEIDIADPSDSFEASIRLKFELNMDSQAFRLASKIPDREERVMKFREMLRVELGTCQLVLK